MDVQENLAIKTEENDEANEDDDDETMIYYGSRDDTDDDEITKLVNDPLLVAKKLRTYKCPACKYTSDKKLNYIKHLGKHLPENPVEYKCAICKDKFGNNNDLIAHKEVHRAEGRSYICKICKMAFTEHRDWVIHEICHLKKLFFKCAECRQFVEGKRLYEQHLKEHYDNRHRCNLCDKVCKTKQQLDNHINSEHLKKQYYCCECGKASTSKESIDYHMTSHTGVKRHQCIYCGKGFGNRQQVMVHTRVHTNERPYHCNDCQKSFKQTTDFKRHTCKAKVLESKYQCDICKRTFKHKESIKLHLKIHTNDRQFKCTHCGHTCITPSALKWHILHKHTEMQSIKCDVPNCNYSTSYRHHIVRHKKNVHKI